MLSNEYKEFESLKLQYNKDIAQRDYINENLEGLKHILVKKEKEVMLYKKANIVLTNVSKITRNVAKEKLESIVTAALQYVYEKDIRFKIILDTKRGLPSAEFKIVTIVDGKESEKDPIYSNGGGVVDVISTALRYSYLVALNEDLADIIILDEPGKMISEGISQKYTEFVSHLAKTFNMQTILITHNDNLGNITDNVVRVENINNCSRITQ